MCDCVDTSCNSAYERLCVTQLVLILASTCESMRLSLNYLFYLTIFAQPLYLFLVYPIHPPLLQLRLCYEVCEADMAQINT